MKKFKILAMALAALTVFSCSKDEAKNNGGTPPVVEGVETYATFNFNVEGATPTGPTTKAFGDDMDPSKSDTGMAALEAVVKNIRVLVYNDADLLEVDQIKNITTAPLISDPIKLTSGTKKIIVLANAPTTLLPTFTAKSPLSELYSKLLYLTSDGAEPTTTNKINMNTIIGGGTNVTTTNTGFFMSTERTADQVKVLAPGVTSEQSKTGGAANNQFTFTVKRGVSKATAQLAKTLAQMAIPAIKDQTPEIQIQDVQGSFRNINKALRPVQLFALENIDPTKVEGASPMAAYFNEFDTWAEGTGDVKDMTKKENFYKYYDRNLKFDLPMKETAPAKSVYISENTNNKQVIGNTTYLAVGVVCRPALVVYDADYRLVGGDGEFYGMRIDAPDVDGSGWASFTKIDLTGLSFLGSGNLALKCNIFKTKTIATKIVEAVLVANGYKKSGATAADHAEYAAQLKKRVTEYVQGRGFYRLNIGNTIPTGFPNEGQMNYGIQRNSKYEITINSFKGLGVGTPGELDDNPQIPVSSQGTYVTATINVAPWVTYTQSGDL